MVQGVEVMIEIVLIIAIAILLKLNRDKEKIFRSKINEFYQFYRPGI